MSMPWLPSTLCGLYMALQLAGVFAASAASGADEPLAGRRDLCGAEGAGDGVCCWGCRDKGCVQGGGAFSLFAELLGDGVDLHQPRTYSNSQKNYE